MKSKFFQGPQQTSQGVAGTSGPVNMKDKGFELISKEENGLLVNPAYVEGETNPVPCKTCFYFRLSGLNM